MIGTDGLTTIERIKDAALHAMHIRAGGKEPPVLVELHVLPVGIEIDVRSYGRQVKRLIGWEVISAARSNVLSATIDELVMNRNARSA